MDPKPICLDIPKQIHLRILKRATHIVPHLHHLAWRSKKLACDHQFSLTLYPKTHQLLLDRYLLFLLTQVKQAQQNPNRAFIQKLRHH